MTELPKLMQADCGHFIPHDSAPKGQRYDSLGSRWLPVYLCSQCSADTADDARTIREYYTGTDPLPVTRAIGAEIKRGPGRPRKIQP